MLGHNGGPSLDRGFGWRQHCWKSAREELLPTLPIEVVRLRVKRATAIGLDYRTYASIRAASGHDVVAFLFSSNALRLLHPHPILPEDRRRRLAELQHTGRGALSRAPLAPAQVVAAAEGLLDLAKQAPRPFAPWSEMAQILADTIGAGNWTRNGTVLVGDTFDERDWAVAARLAFYLPAERLFPA